MSDDSPDFDKAAQELEELNRSLSDTRKTLGKTVEAIRVIPSIDKYSKRTRRMVIGLIFSILLDVTLTVLVGLALVGTNSQSQEIRQASIASCDSSNATRAVEQQLWTTFLGILVPPVKPANVSTAVYAKEKAIADSFLAKVDAAFAQRNCAKLYSANG